MNKKDLLPDFHRGEEVVVLNSKAQVTHRGPLMGVDKPKYGSKNFIIGTETISGWSLYSRGGNILLNAERYDAYLIQERMDEFSGVVDKYVKYASSSLDTERCQKIISLIEQVESIAKEAAEEVSNARNQQQGASIKSFQSMWGNKALTHKEITDKINKSIESSLSINMGDVTSKLESLAKEDSVVAFPRGNNILQEVLKENPSSA